MKPDTYGVVQLNREPSTKMPQRFYWAVEE
jgi:hypothetical protein